jgi:hypothetical protein
MAVRFMVPPFMDISKSSIGYEHMVGPYGLSVKFFLGSRHILWPNSDTRAILTDIS